MSAWIVSKTHIDSLVQALIEADLIDPDKATTTGRMLWRENLRSINYRYPDTIGARAGSYPGPLGFGPKAVTDYTYEPLEGKAFDAPHVVNKAAGCYDYQTCEHPGYARSKARLLVLALSGATSHAERFKLDAPWGIDKRDAFVTAAPAYHDAYESQFARV